MSDSEPRSAMSQFLGLASLLRLLRRWPVERGYRAYALKRLLFSALVEPFRCYEELRWGKTVSQTPLAAPPVFLLGMGRSGTTHLHYLFWQDPRFGFVTNYQASLHPVAMIGRGWLKRKVAAGMPDKRPMDNVAVSLDAPQEEELALATISEHAAFHSASFPRALPDIYDRYVTELGRDEKELEHWQQAYMAVLRKATLLAEGRRLVLKTPAHTGRVALLNEMFPGAKYVYIVRNPYSVYQSMRNMYRLILPGQTFQAIDWDAIDRWIVDAYQKLLGKYLEQRQLIPAENLVEIRFEDLEARPLECMQAIYSQLQLGPFNEVAPRLRTYLDGLQGYTKNRFEFPADVVDTVNTHWGFAFEAFGYSKLTGGDQGYQAPSPAPPTTGQTSEK
ncbi:sulfotransferase [Seongchinamella sediminis]|uniref:Sulfotransferase n=1 Tax=Seongchinamella sediminis TaxID=2283635 RepID=A0A3L7DSJ7_9GAMM|nr:sulfotransferase [Seongchinamella sediminis]RLQ20488.1 sulfotransferase [Seongchinamella sediminis]